MLRYKCEHCGREFEDPDVVTEPHGEKVACCPYCHGWFEEMHECKICEEWHTDDELENGVCDDCIYEHSTDVELCIEFGKDCDEDVSLNCFFATIFTAEQINEILAKEARKAHKIKALDCLPFINGDKSWFAEKLIEGDVING